MHLSYSLFILILLFTHQEQMFFYIISEHSFYVKRFLRIKAVIILLNFHLFCSKVLHILQIYYII